MYNQHKENRDNFATRLFLDMMGDTNLTFQCFNIPSDK
jgi:hypothetical protein